MPLAHDDIIFAERREDVRIIVSIAARVSFPDGGAGRWLACHAVNLSPHAIAFASASPGKVGDRVIAYIEQLGQFEGRIVRLLTGGFVMTISANEQYKENLARKIEWLEKHKNFDISDRRSGRRIVPTDPYTQITTSDGRRENCVILDISVSGAAIAAKTLAKIGDVIAVGTVIGRVVRRFKGGFAVKFFEPQNDLGAKATTMRK